MSLRRAARQEEYAHQILSEIASGRSLSQRTLASRLGIALGMTNVLLRRLVRRGLIRVTLVRPKRVAYFLTPQGMAEMARMSRAQFQRSVQLYATARDRVRTHFEALSRDWPGPDRHDKSILFIGTGEVAEIAYVCLQESDLRLVGVIDFQGRSRFFGVPVFSAAAISDDLRALLAASSPVVIAFTDNEQVQRFLADAGIPAGQVSWV